MTSEVWGCHDGVHGVEARRVFRSVVFAVHTQVAFCIGRDAEISSCSTVWAAFAVP
jgi:hypothetical protein